MGFDKKLEVVKHFDDFENYDIYYEGPWKHYRRRFVNIIQGECRKKENIKILDLGCGRRCSLPGLLSDSNLAAYHCVDLSPESLKVLKSSLGGNRKIKIFESNIIDFAGTCGEKYDVVILFGVIMYLSAPDAVKLFSGISGILNGNGMVLIHEPNEKGENTLHQRRHGMTREFLKDLMRVMRGAHIRKMQNYNIKGFRNPIYFLFSTTKKVLKKIGVESRTLFLLLNKFEDFVWYAESLLETMLAGTGAGCNYLIVLEKNKGRKLLDLGCGTRKRKNAVGVDIMPNEKVDIVHDLNQYPYPFHDNEFDDILLDNSIEHLDSVVKTMEEIWRICTPGARVVVKVPYFRSHFAVDPTHKHSFVSHSFYYFDPRHDFHRLYKYSTKAFFHVEKVVFDEGYNYPLIGGFWLGPVRWFANKYPMRYEEYLAPFFPLHSLVFYLSAVKKQ